MYQKYRYQEDMTAVNPDNRIVGEVQDALGVNNGVIVPTYTPFYSDGLVVRTATATLVRGRDYLVGELASMITAQSGHEASNTIIILEPQLESYTVDYQCVGGPYLNVVPTISKHSGIVYTGPVDWHGVVNKPDLYPPALHPHEIDDVIGWEYLVEALERVRQAIVMSNIPAYEKLIEWVSDTIENYPRADCRDVRWGDPIKQALSLGMYHYEQRTAPIRKEYHIRNVRRVNTAQARSIRWRINTVNVVDGNVLIPIIKYSKDTTLKIIEGGAPSYVVGGSMQLLVPVPVQVIYGAGWHVEIKLINVLDRELDICNLNYEYDDLPLGTQIKWTTRCRMINPFNPINYYLSCR